MNRIDILTQQTQDAYAWANKIADAIPYDLWNKIPENLDTNITWQAGHLTMSIYYQTVMLITGHQPDIISQIPLKEYSQYYTIASAEKSQGKVDPKVLNQQFKLVQKRSLEIIKALKDDQLDLATEPVEREHPFVKTKYESLDWNVKHIMWHCGQMAILKRMLTKRLDFGL